VLQQVDSLPVAGHRARSPRPASSLRRSRRSGRRSAGPLPNFFSIFGLSTGDPARAHVAGAGCPPARGLPEATVARSAARQAGVSVPVPVGGLAPDRARCPYLPRRSRTEPGAHLPRRSRDIPIRIWSPVAQRRFGEPGRVRVPIQRAAGSPRRYKRRRAAVRELSVFLGRAPVVAARLPGARPRAANPPGALCFLGDRKRVERVAAGDGGLVATVTRVSRIAWFSVIATGNK
jgi:hypothetical protein